MLYTGRLKGGVGRTEKSIRGTVRPARRTYTLPAVVRNSTTVRMAAKCSATACHGPLKMATNVIPVGFPTVVP